MATKYFPKNDRKFVNPYHFVSLAKQLEAKFRDSYKQKKQQGDLTGWMECTLETKTPIFIPNRTKTFIKTIVRRNDNNEQIEVQVPGYDFFSYPDLGDQNLSDQTDSLDLTQVKPAIPVIPGSEIRGMIRSAFEAVTHSCLSTLGKDEQETPLFKRVQWPAMRPDPNHEGRVEPAPGRLIFKNGYKIQPCVRHKIRVNQYYAAPPTYGKDKDYLLNLQKTHRTDDGIWFTSTHIDPGAKTVTAITEVKPTNENGWKRGYVHVGERIIGKRHESIFEIIQDADIVDVSQDAIKNLLHNLKLYEDTTVNIHLEKVGEEQHQHTGYKHLSRELDGRLIYYVEHNGHLYLCPAMIGREVFYNRLSQIVDSSLHACSKIGELCDACALFGIAGDQKEAAASRLRFTDAHIKGEYDEQARKNLYDAPRILKELATPKLSATEFYLKKNPENADLWNYDYALLWQRKPDGRVDNVGGWEDLSSYKPQIRGRKFYWHQRNPQPYLNEANNNEREKISERNVQIRPLKADKKFSFNIYFDHISQEELNKLLWVLEIGESTDLKKRKQAHKIGMGKPLGLGSVQICVTAIMRRTVTLGSETVDYSTRPLEGTENLESYKQQAYRKIEPELADATIRQEFLKITNFVNAPQHVSYPYNIPQSPKSGIFSWFVGNRQVRTTGIRPVIEQPLPDISTDNQTFPELKVYEEREQQRR